MRPKNSVNEYSPALFEISEAELSRLDKDKDRDSRQKRRQGRAGRRGAPSLPDFKKVVRTFRTPVYSAVLPGAVDRKVELAKQALQAEEEEEEEDSDGNVVVRPAKRQRTTGRHVPVRAAAANAAVAVAAQSQELETNYVEELADPTSFWVTLKVPPQQLARLMMIPRFG
jgi:SWI/SNF-related matrix-associated actin-dependent regulator of chromatin subfamily B protein 1